MTYVAHQTVEVVEELRFDGVVNCVAADAILIRMAQSRRQIGGPTIPRSRKNFDYRCTWARIQTGFWRSALPVDKLAPCPILNYGCELCCSNVSDVFVCGIQAAKTVPRAIDGNGSIGQVFINGEKRRLTTAWNGLVNAGALNRTRLRAAKRG
jgi:hypothetical protein